MKDPIVYTHLALLPILTFMLRLPWMIIRLKVFGINLFDPFRVAYFLLVSEPGAALRSAPGSG